MDDPGPFAYDPFVAARSERSPLEAGSSAERASEPEAAIDDLLRRVDEPSPSFAADAAPSLRTARVESLAGADVMIRVRGARGPIRAVIDEDVDRSLIARAAAGGDRVLVETTPGSAPVIVGVIQTRAPERLEIRARDVVIEAENEVVIRSGRAAARLRQDGDVELQGSRIALASRGLFRIVGRILRLN